MQTNSTTEKTFKRTKQAQDVMQCTKTGKQQGKRAKPVKNDFKRILWG